MSEKHDNPHAFPSVCLGDPGHPASVPGMSLRDWFAGQALAGLLAHPECRTVGPGHEEATICAAREAYAVSDAMLAERAKRGA